MQETGSIGPRGPSGQASRCNLVAPTHGLEEACCKAWEEVPHNNPRPRGKKDVVDSTTTSLQGAGRADYTFANAPRLLDPASELG